MNFWLTVHWPPSDDEYEPDYDVYVPEDRKQAANDIQAGDKVAIYELKTGRVEVERNPDGTRRKVRRKTGKEGVICLGTVDLNNKPIPNSWKKEYTDSNPIRWLWVGSISELSIDGFVSKNDLLKILGYKSAYNFRGFGDFNSGLKKITEGQFESINRSFHS